MSKLANLKFAALEVSENNYDLKAQYLTVTEPEVLWQELKDRFDNQPDVALPNARYQWQNLRFQDFRSVSEYNYALFKITTQLKLCGQDVIRNHQ